MTRHTLQRSVSAVCVVVALGCSSVSQSTGARSNAWTIPGVVRVSVNTDVNTFDPVISRLYIENYIQEAIFDGLVKYDASGDVVGDLALAPPSRANGGISADGRTFTYHLRKNAVWQDGVPVTSANVRFTYDLIMNPRVNSPVQALYAQVERLDTPDPYTVVLHLRAPFAPALTQIFCNGEFGQIVPQHVLAGSTDVNRDPFNQHPIGSGPYALERWDRGSTMVLRANPRYFGGVPHVREIDIDVIPNSDTQLVSVEGLGLDVATQARPSQIVAYRNVPGMRVLLAPTYVLDYVIFNVTRAPFDDVRVRRALAMALDRSRIAATAFVGAAIPAETMIPPYSWAYDPHNGAPGFAPDSARRLLDAAGWIVGPDGVRVKAGRRLAFGLMHYESATSTVIAEEVERSWRTVGVEAELRTMPRNVFVGSIAPTGTFDAAVTGTGFDADPDRSQYVQRKFFEPNGFNTARYYDADVDRWTDDANGSYDRARRKPFYAQIQRRMNDNMPYVPLAWEQFVYAVNTDLRGFAPETVNSDFWNVQDWTN